MTSNLPKQQSSAFTSHTKSMKMCSIDFLVCCTSSWSNNTNPLKKPAQQTDVTFVSFFIGKNHYLFITWFLYDEMVYFNDREYFANNTDKMESLSIN